MRTKSEKTSIVLNVYKSIETKNSPFDTIIYIFDNGEKFLVEDPRMGKTVLTNMYEIQKLLHLTEVKTNWLRTFDGQYIKVEGNTVFHFLPLFYEQVRKPILTFNLSNRNVPKFRTIEKYINGKTIRCLDNEIDGTSNKTKETTYNYLFQNLKPFKTNNFELEIIEDISNLIYYEDGITMLPRIKITCSVPIFQPHAILYQNLRNSETYGEKYGYTCNLLVMKINDTFYRFPYGNIYQDDRMCFGNNSNCVLEEPPSIAEVCYSHIITSEFNGDFDPMINFNNSVQISLDVDYIREKISQDDFSISFIDVLLYLSSYEDPRDINLNLFLQSPNIPEF